MSSVINQFPNALLQKFADCIVDTMQEIQFRNLTSFVDGIDSFDDLRENNGYRDDLPAYLIRLRKNGTLGSLVRKFLEDNPVVHPDNPDLLAFKAEFGKFFEKDPGSGAYTLRREVFRSCLLNHKAFPFIDRDHFRGIMEKTLHHDAKRVVFVAGPPRSGMSYLAKYLNEICAATRLHRLYEIEVPYYLEGEEDISGEKLAMLIAERLDLEIEFEDEHRDKFKFLRFAEKFNEMVAQKPLTPILFIHDFHKIPVTDSINKFMYEFVRQSARPDNNHFFLILAGFQYDRIRTWHTDLKFSVNVHELNPFTVVDIRTFLTRLYESYTDRIEALLGDAISVEHYIDGILEELEVQQGIEVPRVGEKLTSHLYMLNQ